MARRWRVGELAKASGLTVRTLHHWDALGLVRPGARGANGYRLYGEDDVRRLYRVLALRRLGLPLAEIGAALDAGADLADVMRRHLAVVERELAQARTLRERLAGLLRAVEQGVLPGGADLLELMEHMAMVERYYTREQLDELAARAERLGPEGMARAQRDWAELIEAVRAEQAKGTDPSDPAVLALARRWHELIEAFTGGNPGIRANLERLYSEEGPRRASRGMVDEELSAYLAPALDAVARD